MTCKSLILTTLALMVLLSPAGPAAQSAGVRDVARVAIIDAPLHAPVACMADIRLNGHMLVLTDLLATAPEPTFEQCVLMQGVTGQQADATRRFVLTGAAKMDGIVACDTHAEPRVCAIAATGDFRLLDLETKATVPVTLQLHTAVTGSDVSRHTFRFTATTDICALP